MELNVKDRKLLNKFFTSQSDWMRTNSLLTFENLTEFKKRFLEFISLNACEENSACKLFILKLEQELLECEKKYRLSGNLNGKWYSATNNPVILKWVKESRIVCRISRADIAIINASLEQKIKQNAFERRSSEMDAKNFIVK